MIKIFFLVLFFLNSNFINAKSHTSNIATYYYTYNCYIINHEHTVIRNFPGGQCIYFNNGDYLSLMTDKIAYFNNMGQLIWNHTVHAHHRIIKTNNEKSIVLITSEFKTFKNKQIRFDSISKFNRSGKLLNKWSSLDNLESIKNITNIDLEKKIPADTNWMDTKIYKADGEYTHFNAIYEIPTNKSEKKHPAFQPGNYIVSMQGFGIIAILDKNLKKILWWLNAGLYNVGFHDAQVLPNGNIIYFLNISTATDSPKKNFSTLLEINPFTKKTSWSFTGIPAKTFLSETMGGLQFLPNNLVLFSDNMGHANIIDKKGGTLWSFTNPFPSDNKNLGFLRIRRENLEPFLRNNF